MTTILPKGGQPIKCKDRETSQKSNQKIMGNSKSLPFSGLMRPNHLALGTKGYIWQKPIIPWKSHPQVKHGGGNSMSRVTHDFLHFLCNVTTDLFF